MKDLVETEHSDSMTQIDGSFCIETEQKKHGYDQRLSDIVYLTKPSVEYGPTTKRGTLKRVLFSLGNI